MTGRQLELAAGGHLVDVVEVLDGMAEGAPGIPGANETPESSLAQRNLFADDEKPIELIARGDYKRVARLIAEIEYTGAS